MLPDMPEPLPSTPSPATSSRPASHLGWRLLALVYDLWPVLALWMFVASLFVIAFTFTGHGTHENIAPFSSWQWILWACCWLVTGVYATVSWQRGGQTLGMRPWRLQLVSLSTAPVSRAALWRRFAVGTVSLALGGAGFWWALVDRQRLTWHDRASGTRLQRLPRTPRRG